MPLHEGALWTYEVNGRLRNSVEEVKVIGRTSVDGAPGFAMTGALGTSRLAWKGTKLIASELAGIPYVPAVVLGDFSGASTLPDWQGEIRAYGVTYKATNQAVQEPTTFTLSGRKYPALACQHKLKFGSKSIETKITFVQGLGIVSIEEHRDGQFLGSIHYLAGP